MTKPIAFSDLDDSLFQTPRKFDGEYALDECTPAALDRDMVAASFMNPKQVNLVNWLNETTELIPVTARGTEQLSRVQINFTSWKVTTHGAVILDANNQVNEEWKSQIIGKLNVYQNLLLETKKKADLLIHSMGVDVTCRIITEYDLGVYLVMKHKDSLKLHELYSVNERLSRHTSTGGFYQHKNSNNIAWIPTCIEKGLAVSWLQTQLLAERPDAPVIGLGDSLSDYRFMKLCDLVVIPKTSQFNSLIQYNIFGAKQ
jgi:hydroxymethylpyrimidine pyrophosphatase-like HAD family hydrolase